MERLCGNREHYANSVREAIETFTVENVPPDATGQVRRVAQKFGLIAAAGELAIEWGIFPFTKGEALTAAKQWFAFWLEQRGGHGDIEMGRVLKRIQDHFTMEGSRYIAVDEVHNYQPHRLAGYTWQKAGSNLFLMLGPVFDDLTRGVNRKLLVRELLARNWLALNSNGHPMETKFIGGRNVRGFVFTPSAWEGEADTPSIVTSQYVCASVLDEF